MAPWCAFKLVSYQLDPCVSLKQVIVGIELAFDEVLDFISIDFGGALLQRVLNILAGCCKASLQEDLLLLWTLGLQISRQLDHVLPSDPFFSLLSFK